MADLAPVHYTRGRPGDVAEICALIEKELHHAADARFLSESIAGYPSVVARRRNGLIGFTCSWRTAAPDVLEISNILVSAAHRNQGIGTDLLGRIERLAAADHSGVMLANSMLYSGPGKRPAGRFYDRNGYSAAWRTSQSVFFFKALQPPPWAQCRVA
jgi:GNAT superfamily N-acetyltransferase